MSDITICIPSIPPRREMLARAVESVIRQRRPANIAVAVDTNHDGAWTTRNRAAMMATTEWIGFLDDDDELLSHHTQHLLDTAENEGLDMVWGWFRVVGGTDPFPHYRKRQYDPGQPHIVPITYIVRRELWLDSGGFRPDTIGSWDLQDQPVIDRIHARSGGRLKATGEQTWLWHHHGQNTSGLPSRW